jgi:hypothetical protein
MCVRGSTADGSSLVAVVMSNPKPASISILQEAFSILWEVDVSASPEGFDAGVEASEDSLVIKTTPAKASLAKGLIWRGFFGSKAVSTPPVVLKEKPLSSKGMEPIPEEGLFCRRFLGVSSDPPPLSMESSIQGSKGDHSAASSTRLCEATELGHHSPASKSQRVYSRRVKDGIA